MVPEEAVGSDQQGTYVFIVNEKDVAPYGATFEDGYRTAVVCDALLESAAKKKQVDIKY